MTKQSIFRLLQKGLVSFAFMAGCGTGLRGQNSYISIFGNYGCGSGTGDYDHRLTCLVTPSSSTIAAIPFVDDHYANPWGVASSPGFHTNQFLYNSQYDGTGRLLFSVTAGGVYDNTGSRFYAFDGTEYHDGICSSTTSPYAADYYDAVSEVVIVPPTRPRLQRGCTGKAFATRLSARSSWFATRMHR